MYTSVHICLTGSDSTPMPTLTCVPGPTALTARPHRPADGLLHYFLSWVTGVFLCYIIIRNTEVHIQYTGVHSSVLTADPVSFLCCKFLAGSSSHLVTWQISLLFTSGLCQSLCSNWHPIPYVVHYFWPEAYWPWSKVFYFCFISPLFNQVG